LSKGKIENFGPPYDLLMDKKTIFYELIHNLEKSETIRLIQMAKKSSTSKTTEKLAENKSIKETSQNESVHKSEDLEENEHVLDEEEKLLNK
jgi:hypothetical protein